MRVRFHLLLATWIWLGSSSAALATNNCTFRSAGGRLQLQGDCWTDATLLIPNGATLDGRGRTITALDPQGGHFLGAVIRNSSTTAHVRNLTIEAGELANVCDGEGPPDQRLRGILFEGASGSIVGNTVRNLHQHESGCQEGAGIEVRGAPVTNGGRVEHVTVAYNRVDGYQKTGVFATGAIQIEIIANRIEGFGPTDLIAQNGVQLASGARGTIQRNWVAQNIYTGSGAASAGILLTGAGPLTKVELNWIDDNDVGIYMVSTSDAVVRRNVVRGSTFDGITIDGRQASAQGNLVAYNRVSDAAVGIDLIGVGATSNEVAGNRIADSLQVGVQLALDASGNVLEQNLLRGNASGAFVSGDGNDILDNFIANSDGIGLHVEGTSNEVQGNAVSGSGGLDIENIGGNVYSDNSCTASSGSPVDCP